jgi:hypothetical protein
MDGAGTSSRRPGWTRRHPSSSAPLALERAASVMPEAERWRCWAFGLASGAFGWGRGGLGVASGAFGLASGAFGWGPGTFGLGLTTLGGGWPALGGGPGAFGVEWRALGGGSRGFGLDRGALGGGPGGLGEASRARGVAWRERGERRGADGGGPGASQRGGAPPLRSLAGEHHGSSRAGDGGGGEDQGRVGVTDPPLGSRSDRKCGPSTATRRLQPRGDATSRADVPSRSGNEADGAASAAGRREHFRSDLQPPGCNPPWSGPPRSATKNEVKPCKYLLEMPLLHFADALREHVLVDCHDLRTFATESFESPVVFASSLTLPGASPHSRLLVNGTQIVVAIRLWFNASPCTTSTGRRHPGSDPAGSDKSAHHTSPCAITSRPSPELVERLAFGAHRAQSRARRRHDSWRP